MQYLSTVLERPKLELQDLPHGIHDDHGDTPSVISKTFVPVIECSQTQEEPHNNKQNFLY